MHFPQVMLHLLPGLLPPSFLPPPPVLDGIGIPVHGPGLPVADALGAEIHDTEIHDGLMGFQWNAPIAGRQDDVSDVSLRRT